MDQFYTAISLFRQRKYDQCITVCNSLLEKSPLDQGPWELKLQAMTQRVYVDDVEDDDVGDDVLDTQVMATTTLKPGTAIRATTAGAPLKTASNRPKTSTGRPISGMARPGTLSSSRLATAVGSRTALRTTARTGSARNIRLGSASMFAMGDPAGPIFQTSRMHPAKYAEKQFVAKPLFKYLYYHEGDIRNALELCEAATKTNDHNSKWWWNTQKGRCLIALGNSLRAEEHLKLALGLFYHPETVLLLSKAYIKIDQPNAALEVLKDALLKLPNEISLLTQQARIHELKGTLPESVRTYRQISQIDAMNTEALACTAVHYFYGNQPETALLYYRRILSMGVHSAELFCNIALCCLYGGQLDLVLPCFQRAVRLATSTDQQADLWYNISFVALTTGDINLARRCLLLCISANSSHGSALNNLAVIAAKTGHRGKAKAYLKSAKVYLPESSEIKNNLKLMEE